MRPRWLLLGLCLLSVALGAAALLVNALWRAERVKESSLQLDRFGSIRDEFGPVGGARVRYKGAADAVESNADGRFRLGGHAPASGRVTAWKEGYMIAGKGASETPLELQLKHLPETDCERYAWVDPTPDSARQGNCGNCHGAIYQEWAASGHARSARGLHFRNLFDGTDQDGAEGVGWGLVRERPEGSGVCAACHAPTAGFGADTTKVEGVAAQGVHCDYCHKINGVGDGTIGLTHGRFNLNLLRPTQGQLFFGSLDDVDRGEDAYSPLYKDSK
ncbi:MAG TPA: multiheme c-type cytochrome, partial [Gemmataceae bacterium]